MMSAAWHQLHQNKLMSPAWTSFQSSGLCFCWSFFFFFIVGFSDVNVLSLCNSVYSECALMFLAASSRECRMYLSV